MLQLIQVIADEVVLDGDVAESHNWVRHILENIHIWHIFLYPIIFQEKSIRKGLRYVRGLLVMLIDVDNVNQAESHKWVRHI